MRNTLVAMAFAAFIGVPAQAQGLHVNSFSVPTDTLACIVTPSTAVDSADVVLRFLDKPATWDNRQIKIAFDLHGNPRYMIIMATREKGDSAFAQSSAFRFEPKLEGRIVDTAGQQAKGGVPSVSTEEMVATEDELDRAKLLASLLWAHRCF